MKTERQLVLQTIQNQVLEAVARGGTFASVADLLCRLVEEIAPEVLCSILSLDETGCLHSVSAPSLPAHYSSVIDGLAIGPLVGSCGAAAFSGEPVAVTDIANDPRWAPCRDLALSLDLRACWSSPIKDSSGQVVATFAFYYRTERGPTDLERDIVATCVQLCAIASEHERVQRRNEQLAYFDELTGLANRRKFVESMDRLETQSVGLLLIDVDRLKAVNDRLGHIAGDVLIREIGTRIADATSGEAFRLGGDEFAVLLEMPQEGGIAREAAAILASVGRPICFEKKTILPSVTIGGALRDEAHGGPDGLRQNADYALYHAKETRRGGFVLFERQMRTSITRRSEVVSEIEEALNENRLHPYYQPIVSLETGRIEGLEALVRLVRADGSIVSAGAFSEAFADVRTSLRITDLMMRSVSSDIRSWIDRGIPHPRVGLNLSSADFLDPNLEARICSTFEQAGVPLHCIVLEVVESVLIEGALPAVLQMIGRLRERGVRIALDDFGTGFASLKHLLTLPIDTIKIDRSFVMNMLTDRRSEIIVEALIEIARKLGFMLIAEGIEQSPQADRLRDLGCARGQGYHFARPADRMVTTTLLRGFGTPDRLATAPTSVAVRGRATSVAIVEDRRSEPRHRSHKDRFTQPATAFFDLRHARKRERKKRFDADAQNRSDV